MPRAARPAGGVLVVVESPAKGKTIKRMLGPGYVVLASAGHVKDLPEGRLGVDVERGFLPEYDVLKGKAKVLSDIKRAARTVERVLLATDPDREGEAIAWHIAEELGAVGGDARVRRVLFHELTPAAIEKAIASPLDLDRPRFEAQQARRILDRLVGFGISPVLADRIRRGLSAGRVQSVAVRRVVDREREIEAFRPEERWSLDADLAAATPPGFRARLATIDGRRAVVRDGETARALAAELERAAFTVAAVDRQERRRAPPPPFTTAKLQQEAARRLGFTARKTMTLAQRLYEGVELGDEGLVGLITYMRTDSVRLSTEAVDAVRAHVAERFGKDHIPEEPNVYRGRSKGAQDAHEAVRPTSPAWTPERVAPFLVGPGERDVARLYQLVWQRFVACQMLPAVYHRTAVDIAAGRATYQARGAVLRFPGYLAVYGAKPPDEEAGSEERPDGEGEPDPSPWAERELPPLEGGAMLRLVGLAPEQRFTQPPPRFDEASLVKELEERGIGRPSTYASILETIQERTYVEKVERAFRPTRLGALVTDELVRAFPHELDVAFTAGLELRLDAIEEGTAAWQDVLSGFYGPFEEALERAKQQLGERGETGIPCAKCGKKMVVKFGRNGEFLACPGYPACRHTLNFHRDAGRIVPELDEEVPVPDPCPLCGGAMVMKRGRFGKFLACTRYPACKGTKPVSIGVDCPTGCGGYVSEKRSRNGKTFYGCSSYPACDFVSWDRPRNEPCPDCGNAWVVEKVGRKTGPVVACPNRECGWSRDAAAAPGPGG